MKNAKVKHYRRGVNVLQFTQIESTDNQSNLYTFRVLDNPELTQYLLDNTKNHFVKDKGLYFAKESLFNLISYKRRSDKYGVEKSYLEYKNSIKETPFFPLFQYLSDEGFIPLESNLHDVLAMCNDINDSTPTKGVNRVDAYHIKCSECGNVYDDGEFSVFLDADAAIEDAVGWEVYNNAMYCTKCIDNVDKSADVIVTAKMIVSGELQ